MTDLVVGLGEIGKPLLNLIKSRGIDVEGYDIVFSRIKLRKKYDYIHICLPDSVIDFDKQVLKYKSLGKVIIHSTRKAGTAKRLDVISSPVLGVHDNMDDDLRYYTKWYSGKRDKEFEKRFIKTRNEPDSTVLENSKLYLDLAFLKYIAIYRRLLEAEQIEVNWDYVDEINEKHHNRPHPYNNNKRFGGHCVNEAVHNKIKNGYLKKFLWSDRIFYSQMKDDI